MLNALAAMPTPTGPLCLDPEDAARLRARRLPPARARAAAARAAALADPTRLELATTLAGAPELCVADLAWLSGRAQNLVSHHLRSLRAPGPGARAALGQARLLRPDRRGAHAPARGPRAAAHRLTPPSPAAPSSLWPMGHAHAHGPGHLHLHAGPSAGRGRLGVALGLILALMAAEVVVGLLASSLALLSDAGHMLTDAAALALAIVAARLATRPASGAMTYGLGRVEALSAMANGVTLGVLGLWFIGTGDRAPGRPARRGGRARPRVALAGIAVNLRRHLGAGRRAEPAASTSRAPSSTCSPTLRVHRDRGGGGGDPRLRLRPRRPAGGAGGGRAHAARGGHAGARLGTRRPRGLARGARPRPHRPRAGRARRTSSRFTTCTCGSSDRLPRALGARRGGGRLRLPQGPHRAAALLRERFAIEHATLQVDHDRPAALLRIETS